MRVTIQVPKPHSEKQRIIMNAFNLRGVREVWVACGTKLGKTLGASGALCTSSPLKKQSLWRWVAPIYTQSQIGYDYCSRMLPPAPYVHRRRHGQIISFPSIDTRIQFFHGQRPESLEGEATAGNVLDEAAKMKEEVYAAVKTTTTVTRGKILLISTPLGKNWFYKGCMAAKDEMHRAKREGRHPTKIFITAPSISNPSVGQDIIDDARISLPYRLYQQLYLAEFVEDGTVFAGFRGCLYGDYLDMADTEYQHWYMPGCEKATVCIGADWAKTTDRTVFTAVDMATRKVVGFERFYKTPYTEAIRRLVLFSRKFKQVQVLYHDKTGIGDAIDDQLAYTHLPYEGIVFTNKSKADMVSKLITSVEQQTIELPNWGDLVKEMDAYEVNTTSSGNFTYGAPSGQHDDIVSSIMLCNLGLVQYSDRRSEILFMDELLKNQKIGGPRTIEQYYNSLSEDAEWVR